MNVLPALANYLISQNRTLKIVVDDLSLAQGISLTQNDSIFLDFTQQDNIITICSIASIHEIAYFTPSQIVLDILDPEFLAKVSQITKEWCVRMALDAFAVGAEERIL